MGEDELAALQSDPMIIRVDDAELMTAAKVEIALAVDKFFCKRFGVEGLLFGQFSVDPVPLGYEELF